MGALESAQQFLDAAKKHPGRTLLLLGAAGAAVYATAFLQQRAKTDADSFHPPPVPAQNATPTITLSAPPVTKGIVVAQFAPNTVRSLYREMNIDTDDLGGWEHYNVATEIAKSGERWFDKVWEVRDLETMLFDKQCFGFDGRHWNFYSSFHDPAYKAPEDAHEFIALFPSVAPLVTVTADDCVRPKSRDATAKLAELFSPLFDIVLLNDGDNTKALDSIEFRIKDVLEFSVDGGGIGHSPQLPRLLDVINQYTIPLPRLDQALDLLYGDNAPEPDELPWLKRSLIPSAELPPQRAARFQLVFHNPDAGALAAYLIEMRFRFNNQVVDAGSFWLSI